MHHLSWPLRRMYAWFVNDRRSYPRYSWGWLNRLACELFWKNPGARIRPQYAWGTVFAAAQARALGLSEVVVAEFGVAGGTGLVALEAIASAIPAALSVRPIVYGFDTGIGLPDSSDVRDLPQLYRRGTYRMDFDALKSRIQKNTRLVLGEMAETLAPALQSLPAPVGFVSIDVDLYTSTKAALSLFRDDTPLLRCLPRVVCYCDDIMGVTMSDLTGERLALREYNSAHFPRRGISPVFGLRYDLGWPHSQAQWPDMIFWEHFLDHPQYGILDGLEPAHEAPLRATV